MKNIDTVLFDMDGTLIDTNQLIMESFKYTFNRYGYQFTEQEILAFNGPPLLDTFRNLDPVLADDMVNTYREHNLANHEKYVTVFPDVKETLIELQKREISMGVVSAKMRTGVELGLKTAGIRAFFQTVVTIDDVIHAKPHPEPVLMGMESLNASPGTTLMVGDNYHDIESGNNAGTMTAGVAWSEKGATYLKQFKPTYMLQSMLDILEIIEG